MFYLFLFLVEFFDLGETNEVQSTPFGRHKVFSVAHLPNKLLLRFCVVKIRLFPKNL